MPRECDCAGGNCKPTADITRRQFVAFVGAGAATVSMKPDQPEAEQFAAAPADLATWKADLESAGKPRTYSSDRNTDARLHLGGIGTGNIEIGVDGQLTTWQLFNTLRDGEVPFYFAARCGGVFRLLQTKGGPDWPGVQRITMRGEYPFAFLNYEDPDLPVQIELESFTPFAPLETDLSSIPTAMFVFRVHNPTAATQRVALAAFMQNPVGYEAAGQPSGNRHEYYGGNVNRVRSEGRAAVLHMGARIGKAPTLDRDIRICTNLDLGALNYPFNDRPERLTLARLDAIAAAGSDPATTLIWMEDAPADLPAERLRDAASAVRNGATLVLSGSDAPLLRAYGYASGGRDLDTAEVRPPIRFDDFESGYDGWTVEGAAFGTEPARGTLPGQQRVSGFGGKGLVNSFRQGDETTGRMISRPFTIERRYIRFLIGGGASAQTQIRLVLGDRIVRSASGANDERLLPASWDVAEFVGREARLHIVDEATGPWGHINVDNIEFADTPGDIDTLKALEELLPARFGQIKTGAVNPITGKRPVEYTALTLTDGSTMMRLSGGPAAIVKPMGKGKVVLYQGGLLGQSHLGLVRQRQRAYQLLCSLVDARYSAPAGLHPGSPGAGELELAALRSGSTVLPGFTDWQAVSNALSATGGFKTSAGSPTPPTPEGESINGAIASTVVLQPGQTVEIPFALTWRYPNSYTRQGVPLGNHYARQYPSVQAVTRAVVTQFNKLRQTSETFRKTFYDSTLPYWLLDCVTANAAIIRHIGIVFRPGNGDVHGWEGSNGCCQPTCTHVWGYEQTLASFFPDLERIMRRLDFMHQQREDGGVNNRMEVPSPPRPTGEQPFADGHASCILKAYREARNTTDESFFRVYWPHIKRAVEYLIGRDAATSGGKPDGTLEDDQWNTYDQPLHGVTTFISGYYLAALRAGEEWAKRVGDTETARRFRQIFELGQQKLVDLCWDGEYFRQHLPGYEKLPGEVGPGCMADQLIGQWWAHQLGLGYLLPEDKVRSAIKSVFRYNWMTDLTGWRHMPRAFAGDRDKGLMIVTWPKGGRPPHVMLYSDEVWTGIEYQVAAHLIYEGMVQEGLAIVKGARDRYDGVPRPPLMRNPWNEIECGGHYARAMSSWSLITAAAGFEYDGPAHALRFQPRITPNRFKTFFCGPAGWGSLSQEIAGGQQSNVITLAHGSFKVARLTLAAPATAKTALIRLDNEPIAARVTIADGAMTLTVASPITLRTGQSLTVTIG